MSYLSQTRNTVFSKFNKTEIKLVHRSASSSCQFAQKYILLIILQMCCERQKKY